MNGGEILERARLLVGEHGTPRIEDVNRAYRSILKRSGWWVSRTADDQTLVFQNDKARYRLPLSKMRRLEEIAVRETENEQEWHKLWPLTQEEFDRQVEFNRKNDGTDQTNRPEFYVLYGGMDDNLRVVPTPDAEYQARLVYITEPDELGVNDEPVIPESYHEDIAYMTASDVLLESTDEAAVAKGGRLRGIARRSLNDLTHDLGHNRAGVGMPSQRLLRMASRPRRIIRT